MGSLDGDGFGVSSGAVALSTGRWCYGLFQVLWSITARTRCLQLRWCYGALCVWVVVRAVLSSALVILKLRRQNNSGRDVLGSPHQYDRYQDLVGVRSTWMNSALFNEVASLQCNAIMQCNAGRENETVEKLCPSVHRPPVDSFSHPHPLPSTVSTSSEVQNGANTNEISHERTALRAPNPLGTTRKTGGAVRFRFLRTTYQLTPTLCYVCFCSLHRHKRESHRLARQAEATAAGGGEEGQRRPPLPPTESPLP